MKNKVNFMIGKGALFSLLFAAICVVAIVASTGGFTVSAEEPKIVTADDAPPEAALKATFDLSDPDRIKTGKKQFNQTCAAWCHGKDPVLFVEREGLDEQFVYKTIRDGGVGDKSPMPSWGSTFTSEEIWELVAYIKSIGKW